MVVFWWSFYWILGYNPSLLILWMTCWGFGFKSYDLSYCIYSFCSLGRYFFQPNSLPGPYSSTGACYFIGKICTKIIFEDKYFTTLILFPCQFIHVKRKLFIFIYSRLKSNYSASCSLHQNQHPYQHQARFLLQPQRFFNQLLHRAGIQARALIYFYVLFTRAAIQTGP